MRKFKLYCYDHDSCKYYGQGLNENYVRTALEDKLNLDEDSLRKGYEVTNNAVFKSVIHKNFNDSFIYGCLKIPENIRLRNVRFDDVKKYKMYTPERLKSYMNKTFNIPLDDINPADNPLILDLLHRTNNKVQLKTHKLHKTKSLVNVSISGMDLPEYKSKIVNITSRVDEFTETISRLLSLDYNLFFDIVNYEEEISRAKNTISKARTYISGDSKVSKEKRERSKEILNDYPALIQKLEKEASLSNNRVHNTFYYVSSTDVYLHNTYEEMLQHFDDVYETLRKKITRSYLGRIKYKDTEFTLIEMLDSFHLTRRQNNYNEHRISEGNN